MRDTPTPLASSMTILYSAGRKVLKPRMRLGWPLNRRFTPLMTMLVAMARSSERVVYEEKRVARGGG